MIAHVHISIVSAMENSSKVVVSWIITTTSINLHLERFLQPKLTEIASIF